MILCNWTIFRVVEQCYKLPRSLGSILPHFKNEFRPLKVLRCSTHPQSVRGFAMMQESTLNLNNKNQYTLYMSTEGGKPEPTLDVVGPVVGFRKVAM